MKETASERIIDKSRFIGHIRPVETRVEAEAFLAEIRTIHKAATHNVPAFVIGDQYQIQWASDDGEPQGTSGAPIVQMLVKEEITNIAVVVTRYFGGIKLGTGGLVRAYTSTVKQALEEGGLCAVKELNQLSIKLDYTFYGKLQNLAANGLFEIQNTYYEDMVTTELTADPENLQEVKTLIANLTGGSAKILSESVGLARVPI